MLGEEFAAFELRCNLRRPDNRKISRAKSVTDALDQRQLRADDGQIGAQPFGQRHQAFPVRGFHRQTDGLCRNSAVANDQNFHESADGPKISSPTIVAAPPTVNVAPFLPVLQLTRRGLALRISSPHEKERTRAEIPSQTLKRTLA